MAQEFLIDLGFSALAVLVEIHILPTEFQQCAVNILPTITIKSTIEAPGAH
jgi:hypothetical protein